MSECLIKRKSPMRQRNTNSTRLGLWRKRKTADIGVSSEGVNGGRDCTMPLSQFNNGRVVAPNQDFFGNIKLLSPFVTYNVTYFNKWCLNMFQHPNVVV